MTPYAKVIESGMYRVDENGIGHLYANGDDNAEQCSNEYFVPISHRRFALIRKDGQTQFMKQIDEGGRAPAGSSTGQ